MADCTEDLRAEHRGVLLMLDILGAMEDRFEVGEPVPPEDLRESLDFLETFVDRCHHGKEEGLLFPAMVSADLPDTEDTIAQLQQEHVMGREYVGRIAEEIEAYEEGETSIGRTIAEDLHGYAQMLRRHIATEDDVLYPAAEEGLSPETQEELQSGYDRIERDVVGQGRHEAFHEMLDRMKAEYLSDEPIPHQPSYPGSGGGL